LFTSKSLLVTSPHANTNRNGPLLVTTVQALRYFLPSESEMKLVATLLLVEEDHLDLFFVLLEG
jgi:hypothetical protein